MKVVEFKSVSPLFEMERDGIKYFTHRLVTKDSRFRALSRWSYRSKWFIKITNPTTGESFTRPIVVVDFLRYWGESEDWNDLQTDVKWKVIVWGTEEVSNEGKR